MLTETREQIREGWTYLGKHTHYVRNGRSICGRWWTGFTVPDDGDCPEEERCRRCVQARNKELRGGTRLHKQVRNRKGKTNGQ